MQISGNKQIEQWLSADRIKTFVFPRRNIPYVASKY